VWLRLHRNSVRPIRSRHHDIVTHTKRAHFGLLEPGELLPLAFRILRDRRTSPHCIACLFLFLYPSHSQAPRPAIRSRTTASRLSRLLQLLAWRIARLVAVHFFPSHTSHFQKLQAQSSMRLYFPLHLQFLLWHHLVNRRLAPRQAKNGKSKRTGSESCMKSKICHLKR